MSTFSTAYGLLRFGGGLRAFLRAPISLETARAVIERRMRRREEAFLGMLERAVFGHPRSPYLALFRWAGCELDDLRALVAREGVEGALEKLLDAGVHVDFDEFKGRRPAVRGSRTFRFRSADFDNPLGAWRYPIWSGGTGGPPTRILIDLDYLADRAPLWAVWFAAHDLLASPLVFLAPHYPGIVNLQLLCARFGTRFVRWFVMAGGGPPAYRLATGYVHALARWAGGFPKPEWIRGGDLPKVLDALAEMTNGGLRPAVHCSPSDAVRLCLAARERRSRLETVTFLLGYEPLTPARRATIEAEGARVAMSYGISEGGTIGQQCPQPDHPDDVHVASDAFALLSRPRAVQDETVEALLLTALGAAPPKIMINVEIGDTATTAERACGCVFDRLGHRRHLHTIRSFEKLTGAGVTIAGADLYRILEEIVPRRFGGSLGDYQLLEEEDATGVPRYRLLVSPAVGELDERALIAGFLEELGRVRAQYRIMARQWADADLLRVVRRPPILTARGKLLPFRTLRSAEAGPQAR